MKKTILILALVLAFTACKKDDDFITDVETSKKNLSDGSWRVSCFHEKGKDETSDFAGYTLQFLENGILNINTPSSTFIGNWSMQAASNKHGQKLIISVAGNKQVEELDDDWLVISITGNLIKLKDDNITLVEELHLEKN